MTDETRSALLRKVRVSVIGEDQVMAGPYGPRRVTYAEYTASGRALTFIEDFICDEVRPRYANTHTESSGTGLQTTRLREDARTIIHDAVGADADYAVIFAGSGATGAIDKLIGILGLRIPSALEDRYRLARHIRPDQRPVVFIGPFEHHSNELPWRESIADVVTIGQDADGHIDLGALEQQLIPHAARPLKIGSCSAASNVTGILSDTAAMASLLHQHGALSLWDCAAAGPYIQLRVTAPLGQPDAYKDAIFLSPHKFIGGPGTPGVLVVRRELLTNRVPDVPGGGTVQYVNPAEHVYLHDPIAREEGGTPAIVEAIRAGLVFALKQAVGVDLIRAHEEEFLHRATRAWTAEHVLPQWSAVRLIDITHADVQAWVSRLAAHGAALAGDGAQGPSRVFTHGQDGRQGRSTGAEPGRRDQPAAGRRHRAPISHPRAGACIGEALAKPAEISKHRRLDERENRANRLIVLFLAYTGVRFGELAALRVGRPGLLRRRAIIAESVTVVQGRGQVWGTPKSYEQREVPIPRFLINDLAEHVRAKSRDDLVFTGVRSGTALRAAVFRRAGFDMAAAAIGIYGLHPHELRHTAASLAIASGANVKVVQQMLGHKSATVTLDQYGHLFGDDLDAIADRLDAQARTVRGLLADYLRTDGQLIKLPSAGPEATAQ